MYSVETHRSPGNHRFDAVAEPFLQQSGLPFAEVLTGEVIARAFARHDALFAEEDIFCTSIVLWAFLAQVLRGGKGAACAAAVADIATYLQQTGGRARRYCRLGCSWRRGRAGMCGNCGVWLWSGSPPTKSPIALVVSNPACSNDDDTVTL